MARLALVIWLLLIAWWTLTPAPQAVGLVELTPWWCISCGEAGTADLFQNLLLFVPIGLALRAMGWPLPRSAAVAFFLTLGIELTQGTLLPGRDATLGDLLSNTLGALLGWAALPTCIAVARPTARTGQRMAAIALGVFTMQLVISAWLLRPAPGAAPWQVEATPVRPDGTQFEGTLLDISLDETTQETALTLATTWVAPAGPGMLGLARLVRGPTAGVAGVSVGDGRVQAGMRTRANAVRLRSPIVSVPLPVLANGDTLQVRLAHGRGALTLEASGASGEVSRATAPLGAQHGWLLINPFSQSVDLAIGWQRWTLAWLLGWGLLLGWGAGATHRWVEWAIGGGIVLLVVPRLARAPLGTAEWLGVAIGWAIAAGAGRMRRGVTPRKE